MNVTISGSSGFIGSAISRALKTKGWQVKKINRASLLISTDLFLKEFIEGADVIINLAGAPVQKRWTTSYKKEIVSSRVETTLKIADAMNKAEKKTSLMISASAVGIYDSFHHHDEESSSLGEDFLAEVCRKWEDAARRTEKQTRLVVLRIGVVLGKEGGMLKKVAPLFRIGLGGKIGNGAQMMSWIHLSDLLRMVNFIIEHPAIEGVVNAVSPEPVSNQVFTQALGKVLGQPTFFTVPPLALKLMVGETAGMMLSGQTVIPQKLLENGFEFEFPSIGKALKDIYH